jgi:LysR family transcriptional regulator, regulator of abg operon
MKLNQLRHFLAVVDAGTVRQAAKQLNLSQSSVTKSIQQLEFSLHTSLFHRGSHGLVPTAAGQALIARAKVIEAELRQIRNDVEAIQGAEVGQIRVSASPTVSVGLLPRAIGAFKRSHPRVSFHIEEGVYPDILPAVRMGDLDMAISLVPETPGEDDLEFTLLLRDNLVPAVRADHPLTRRGKLSLAELVGEGWVIYRRGRTGRDVFERSFTTNNLEPPTDTIECTSFACTLAIVENTDYLTLVPTQYFSTGSRHMPITPIFLETPMQPWNVTVISRAHYQLNQICQRFLEELRRTADRARLSAI